MVHEQKIPYEVQQPNADESDTAKMGNSNVIPYEQYVKHNDVFAVPSSASYVVDNDHEFQKYLVCPR